MFCIIIEHKTVTAKQFFLNILQKYYQLHILGILDIKRILQTCRNFDLYLHAIKWPSFLTSFLRYCKDIANSLHWVIWECLIMPINNDNINLVGNFDAQSVFLNLWCFSACKKSISSLTSFLRYYKDITNLQF